MEQQNCVSCENYYVWSSATGKCHRVGRVVNSSDNVCKYYVKRRVEFVPELLNEIATIFLENKEAVLLDNGSPSIRFTPDESVTEVEIILRTVCNSTHKYHVVTD